MKISNDKAAENSTQGEDEAESGDIVTSADMSIFERFSKSTDRHIMLVFQYL